VRRPDDSTGRQSSGHGEHGRMMIAVALVATSKKATNPGRTLMSDPR
jgi:hypothetical protein